MSGFGKIIPIFDQWQEVFSLGLSTTALLASMVSLALTLSESRRARRAHLKPYLFLMGLGPDNDYRKHEPTPFLHVRGDDGACESQLEYPLQLLVKNVGVGPAVEIRIKNIGELSPYFDSPIENQWFALGAGEETVFLVLLRYTGDLNLTWGKEYTIGVEYRDTAGEKYETGIIAEISPTYCGIDPGSPSRYAISTVKRLRVKR